MVSISEQELSVGSVQWFYRQADPVNRSDKPPVLLLHGLPSQSYGWREILPVLAEQGLQAIAPDWIGFGYSAKPDRRQFAYTPEAFLSALAAFVQALEIERFSLVVQGFLGSVGLQYALRHPEQIERLAICNTPLATAVRLPWRIQQLGLPLVGEMLTQDPLLVDRTLEGGGKYRVADRDLDVYRRPFLRSSEAGRALLATVRNLHLPQAMAEIEAGFADWTRPTLLIWGLADPWLPVSLAEQFAARLKVAALDRLDQVGHYPQEDWSEKVAQSLLPFLRRPVV